MTTTPLHHKGPPNVDAERAENELLRYVIDAFREGCEDADAIANVACPEAP